MFPLSLSTRIICPSPVFEQETHCRPRADAYRPYQWRHGCTRVADQAEVSVFELRSKPSVADVGANEVFRDHPGKLRV